MQRLPFPRLRPHDPDKNERGLGAREIPPSEVERQGRIVQLVAAPPGYKKALGTRTSISPGVLFAVSGSLRAAFNLDLSKEPDMDPPEALLPVLTMLDSVESPNKFALASFPDSRVSSFIVVTGWNESFRSLHIPRGEKVIHSFMMATDESVSKQENVLIIQIMEEEIIRLAKRKGYSAILTTNTNALTQQLASLLGYELLQDFQVNQFVMPDGSTPFSRAPDEQRAICVLKHI
ncbi:unnamed protein product [Darwinula stevensoni]|uniref:Uncharacterized protein n=1 Tax=Darwinula stevensoni TaxID=69355 RepID=A0A7R9AFB8_9CRUS|nr:unnamed protein product [Darwinula stevensoni]CAG0902832.1 unnamed protein product [Darwinula stevensoni]